MSLNHLYQFGKNKFAYRFAFVIFKIVSLKSELAEKIRKIEELKKEKLQPKKAEEAASNKICALLKKLNTVQADLRSERLQVKELTNINMDLQGQVIKNHRALIGKFLDSLAFLSPGRKASWKKIVL